MRVLVVEERSGSPPDCAPIQAPRRRLILTKEADVHLDQHFKVLGSESDGAGEDRDPS